MITFGDVAPFLVHLLDRKKQIMTTNHGHRNLDIFDTIGFLGKQSKMTLPSLFLLTTMVVASRE
jgi:hypothetical protein